MGEFLLSQRRLTAALIGALLVCLLAGGVGAYFLGQRRSDAAAGVTPPSRPTVTRTTVTYVTDTDGSPATDTGSGEPTGDGPGPPTSAPEPSADQSTPADQNDRTVRLADAVSADPQADEIRELMQRHFDAINNGDYKLWAGTVTSDQVAAIPPDRWRKEYSTTIDTAIAVVAVDSDPRRVQLSFRSRQAPEFAPDKKSKCLEWKVSLPLTTVSGQLLIGRSIQDQASWNPCAAG